MLKTIKHVKGRVEAILREYPETRNCDKLLCITYWKLIDEVKDLDGIQFATCPEAIRRARQWLNERGQYLATDPEVLKKRRYNAREMRIGVAKI